MTCTHSPYWRGAGACMQCRAEDAETMAKHFAANADVEHAAWLKACDDLAEFKTRTTRLGEDVHALNKELAKKEAELAAAKAELSQISGVVESMREDHRENCEALQKELAVANDAKELGIAAALLAAKNFQADLAAAKEAMSIERGLSVLRQESAYRVNERANDAEALARRLAVALRQIITSRKALLTPRHKAEAIEVLQNPAVAALLSPVEGKAQRIDPPGCACTDCITGYSRPAEEKKS